MVATERNINNIASVDASGTTGVEGRVDVGLVARLVARLLQRLPQRLPGRLDERAARAA